MKNGNASQQDLNNFGKNSHGDFFAEIKKRNKEKFINVVSEKVKSFGDDVDLNPAITAEALYKEMQRQDAFDKYGYIKQGVKFNV